MMENNIKRLFKLEHDIKWHDFLYYGVDRPEISDSSYDTLLSEYHTLLKDTPCFEPSVDLGIPSIKTETLTYPITEQFPIIQKLQTPEKFTQWTKENKNRIIYENKIEGVLIRLVYLEGNLFSIYMKGNNEHGIDISHRRHLIKEIPDVFSDIFFTNKIQYKEVMGIAYCKKGDLEHYVESHELNKDEVTPRSCIASLLKKSDSSDLDDLPIYFKALSVNKGLMEEIKSYITLKSILAEAGFTPPATISESFINEMLTNHVNPIDEEKEDFITGVVGKNDDLKKWVVNLKSGYIEGSKIYGYPPQIVSGKLIGMEWDLSSQGYLVGWGMVLTDDNSDHPIKARVHSPDNYFEKGIKVNTVVEISKNDTGKLSVGRILESGKGEKLVYPVTCPYCQELLVKEKKGSVRCINEGCSGQLFNKMSRMVSPKGLNITSLDKSTLNTLIDHGFLTSSPDIFKLEQKDFLSVDFTDEKSKSIMEEIVKSKKSSLAQWVYASSITRVDMARSAEIAECVNSFVGKTNEHYLDKLMESVTDLTKMFGLFGLDALPIVKYVIGNQKEIREFFSFFDFINNRVNNFNGVLVAISGTWKTYPRVTLEKELLLKGWSLENNVTEQISCLLVGEYPSPGKVAKAKELNIPIVDIRNIYEINSVCKLLNKSCKE